jgi:hypothetical protein
MRCPKCHTETPPAAANCPGCNLATPRGKQDKQREREREYDRKTRKVFLSGLSFRRKRSGKKENDGEPSRAGTIVRIVIIVAAIALAGFGSYLLVFSIWESKHADPVLSLKAMEKFRSMPSNEEGLTVDEVMKQELKKFKDSSNLKGSQGWHTQKINGSDSRVLVVFSFQDGAGQDHRAEWLVDVKSQRYIPQTALAIEMYNK